jgi:hypothetical protein
VNALAPFGVSVVPVKQGKKVVQIRVGWWTKDSNALREAFEELQRSRTGRRARATDTVEYVTDPLPSISRLIRSVS